MVKKCAGCGNYLSALEGAAPQCVGCSQVFHRVCVNMRDGVHVPDLWTCPECKSAKPNPGYNKDSTPLKAPSSSKSEDGLDQTFESQDPPLVTEIRLLRDEMREEMRAVRDELRAFRQEMADLRMQVSACNLRIDELEDKVEAMAKDRGAEGGEVAKVVQELEATVVRLQLDLNDRDQEQLSNDIEISGVPEESGENPVHILMACSVKLGVTLDERDVVSCTRVGARPAAAGGAGAGRPRPLAVRLTRRAARTELLLAARTRRSLTTEGLGLKAEARPFFVNERLTKTNRQLFYQARESGRRNGWRFVWTREGRIYARRDSDAPANRIRNESDLEKVFGPDYVRRNRDRTSQFN